MNLATLINAKTLGRKDAEKMGLGGVAKPNHVYAPCVHEGEADQRSSHCSSAPLRLCLKFDLTRFT